MARERFWNGNHRVGAIDHFGFVLAEDGELSHDVLEILCLTLNVI